MLGSRLVASLRHVLAGLALVLGLVLLEGCSGKKALGTVRGRVTYRNQAVSGAEVHFHSKEQGAGITARIDGTGEYAFEAPVPVGTYAVWIALPPPEPGDPSRPSRPSRVTSKIPRKYFDMNTSGLSFTVKEGDNEFPIELKD